LVPALFEYAYTSESLSARVDAHASASYPKSKISSWHLDTD